MTTTLTITSGQASFTSQNYKILPSPGTAVPDNLVNAILQAAATANVSLSTSAGGSSVVSQDVPEFASAAYTYNADGSVATETVAGVVTTYGYNSDGTIHTATRNGATLTYTYNADGTVAGVA